MPKKSFTLVELMVAAGVFAIVSLSIIAVVVSWKRSWNISEVRMNTQFEARRIIRRLTEDIVETSPDYVDITNSSSVITFRVPDSYSSATGIITWGDEIMYSLGGTNNRQLIRANLDTGATEVVGNNIDYLYFNITDYMVGIRFKVNETLRRDTVVMNLTSQVNLRNR